MKALVRHVYGSPNVLHVEEVPMPTIGDGDLLVKVHAASANAADWHLLRGTPLPFRVIEGFRTPKHRIIGNDIAGRVEAVGKNVTQFRPGDEVFGELSRCGFGAYAAFVAAPEKAFALKPTNLSFEEAAALPTAGCTALQGLRKGSIQRGQTVLVHGAAGGVGIAHIGPVGLHGVELEPELVRAHQVVGIEEKYVGARGLFEPRETRE